MSIGRKTKKKKKGEPITAKYLPIGFRSFVDKKLKFSKAFLRKKFVG